MTNPVTRFMRIAAAIAAVHLLSSCMVDSGPPDPKMVGPIDMANLWQPWELDAYETAWDVDAEKAGNVVDYYTHIGGTADWLGYLVRYRFDIRRGSDTCFIINRKGFSLWGPDNRIEYYPESEKTKIIFSHGIDSENYPITKLTQDTMIYRNGGTYVFHTFARDRILVDTTEGKYDIMWPKP